MKKKMLSMAALLLLFIYQAPAQVRPGVELEGGNAWLLSSKLQPAFDQGSAFRLSFLYPLAHSHWEAGLRYGRSAYCSAAGYFSNTDRSRLTLYQYQAVGRYYFNPAAQWRGFAQLAAGFGKMQSRDSFNSHDEWQRSGGLSGSLGAGLEWQCSSRLALLASGQVSYWDGADLLIGRSITTNQAWDLTASLGVRFTLHGR